MRALFQCNIHVLHSELMASKISMMTVFCCFLFSLLKFLFALGVMMAARSLIQLFRQTNPSLLHKKDRGRPTEAAPTVLEYGESRPANECVPGAEVYFVCVGV